MDSRQPPLNTHPEPRRQPARALTYLIGAILVLALAACETNTPPLADTQPPDTQPEQPHENEPPTSNQPFTLTAPLLDYTLDEDATVTLLSLERDEDGLVVGGGTISATAGGAWLALEGEGPDAIPDAYLTDLLYQSVHWSCRSSLIVPFFKSMLVEAVFEAPSGAFGQIYGSLGVNRAVLVLPILIDRDVAIAGLCTDGDVLTEVNIDLKRGWNFISSEMTQSFERFVSVSDLEEIAWRAEVFPGEPESDAGSFSVNAELEGYGFDAGAEVFVQVETDDVYIVGGGSVSVSDSGASLMVSGWDVDDVPAEVFTTDAFDEIDAVCGGDAGVPYFASAFALVVFTLPDDALGFIAAADATLAARVALLLADRDVSISVDCWADLGDGLARFEAELALVRGWNMVQQFDTAEGTRIENVASQEAVRWAVFGAWDGLER